MGAAAPFFFLSVGSFLLRSPPSQRRRQSFSSSSVVTTTRYGINEWRDLTYEYEGDISKWGTEMTTAPPRPINLLPFPYDEILLQGETKQLRLYEDRFLRLFDDAQTHHGGVLAMGLMASSG